jgi:hypothetical protein
MNPASAYSVWHPSCESLPSVKVFAMSRLIRFRVMQRWHRSFGGLLALACAVFGTGHLAAQGVDEFEQSPIQYSATAPRDAITRLEARLKSGEAKLAGSDREIALTLLRELNIPVESQVLVFSKTSFQRERITPTTPRALYFSDDCYIGWVPGGLLEVASMDPELGPIFYTFDPHEQPKPGKVRFERDEDCLRCHGGQFVRGIPSVFVRSLPTDDAGEPLLRFGSEVVDHRTPFEQRWGGWYVTGQHGQALHRGNVFSRDEKGELSVDFRRGANVTNLASYFDTSRYLTGTSDVVALLVLEHQLAMHNALTRAAFSARRLMHYQTSVQRDLKETVSDAPTYDSVKRVFDNAAQDVVDHLLFKDEAPLPAGGVQGNPEFQRAFAARARPAPDGSSLRELDLRARIFRYRCSPLIDSASFRALPPALKQRIYARLAKALHPTEPDPRYAHLEAPERARIVGILRATHEGLPAGWLAN